jgi:hypothetical protein
MPPAPRRADARARPAYARLTCAELACAIGALVLGAAGCNLNDPTYFDCGSATCAPATTAPLEALGDGTEVTQTLQLEFRTPTAGEQQDLQTLSAQVGYTVPWLREDQIHLELLYTITNLTPLKDANGVDNPAAAFSLNIDGASEFYRYDETAVAAAFTAANMDPVVHGLFQAIPQILSPGEVYQGIVREDDFHEMSWDLDAMGRWGIPFLSVLLTPSETLLAPPSPSDTADIAALKALVQPNPANGVVGVPTNLIRPALWEITPRFNSDQHMTCQFLVRVRDDDQRLWKDGDDALMPAPMTFMPVIPPMN